VSLETTDVTAPDSPCFALARARTAARGVERTQLDRCANSNAHSIQERIHGGFAGPGRSETMDAPVGLYEQSNVEFRDPRSPANPQPVGFPG